MEKSNPVKLPQTAHDTTNAAAYSRPSGRLHKVIVIIGVVLLCTIVLAPVGVVISLIGYLMVRRSGTPSRLALVGLVGNGVLVFMAASILLYLIFFSPELTDNLIKRLTVAKQSSLEQTTEQSQRQQGDTAAGKAAAGKVVHRSKLYRDINGVYPLMLTDFERDNATSLEKLSDVIISVKPLNDTTGYSTRKVAGKDAIVSHLTIHTCGTTEGNKIGYWNIETNDVAFAYSGHANQGSTCAIMK